MTRTIVITGAASGIGRATAELLAERGNRIIGVDLRGSDIDADLTTPEGRRALVDGVRDLSGGAVDGVIANAGLASPTVATAAVNYFGAVDGVIANAGLASPTVATAAVNYFGAVATLEGLRPLLAESPAPRAVATASMASLYPPDEALLDRLLDGDEDAALSRAGELAAGSPEEANAIYGTTKRALARWIRRHAPSPEWAGAGIPLNAIAPGVVSTAMTEQFTSTEQAREAILQMVPMPLNGIFPPRDAAYLLAWLVSEENAHLCGQVIFIDGGSDAVMRGDSTW